jgi:hypothetical protein
MLYYYIMAHHHHPSDATHPSPTIAPSLLRLSVFERLAIVAILIALMGAAVFWATY